uniref:Uncharacterized protein n=1 Tax=Anguilla anguilla TaxID=7936 RepID=A0A0E9UP76_ANGAN
MWMLHVLQNMANENETWSSCGQPVRTIPNTSMTKEDSKNCWRRPTKLDHCHKGDTTRQTCTAG